MNSTPAGTHTQAPEESPPSGDSTAANGAGSDVRIPSDTLRTALVDLFAHAGMHGDNAEFCADCIVQMNLWGIDSHGVLRLPDYLERLRKRVVKANPEVHKLAGDGAFEVLHGDNGMGFLVARDAMARAIELAKTHHIAAVTVSHSNHFGAAALFAKMAADRDKIGIAMTNVRPNLVVPGGSKPITGNNPISVGAPTAEDFPFLLDISMSAVAGGKLLLAIKNGEKIPLDWATDRAGRSTDDPQTGFDGFLLPLGGHKGFGLSLVVDLLCGVISGGAFQHDIKSMYADPDAPSGTSHTMIVLDPCVFLSKAQYLERMAAFYRTIKQSPMWDDTKQMYLPGEIEHRTQLERQAHGIPVSPSLYRDLLKLSDKLNVTE